MSESLTPQQSRFVEEYLIDLNATQAAIRAGYSEKTAKQIGSRLLTNVDIAAEVERRVQELCKRYSVTHGNVLSELAAIAFSDIRDVGEVQGGRIMAHDTETWTEPAARAVQSIGESKYGPQVKCYDKLKALDLLGKYLSLWREESQAQTVEFTINVNGKDES